jgi:3-oxoacyl-[acyl-carrier protein] reductase
MPPTSDAIAECRFCIADFARVDHRIYDSSEVEMRLNGKTAIITGAGSGFGAGIAQKFAQEGAQVMMAAINMDGAQTVANSISGLAQYIDVTSNASVQQMIAAAEARWGRIDILVDNAGITHLPTPMEDVSEKEFD